MAVDRDPSDDPSGNPFVRFKNHVDNNIHRGFQAIVQSTVSTVSTETQYQYQNDAPPNGNRSITTTTTTSLDRPTPAPAPPAPREAVPAADVLEWAATSPYSPLNLQTLAQPRPRDAPRGCADCFTFRDAFEDLLGAGAGQPAADLQQLLFARRFERARQFPGDGLPVGDWAADLARRRLWDAYFSLSPPARRELARRRGADAFPWGWPPPARDAVFRTPDVWAWPRAELRFFGGDRDGWDERPHAWTGRHGACQRRPAAEASPRREPDSEGDLYDAIQSDFATDSRAGANASRARVAGRASANTSWGDVFAHAEDTTPGTHTISTPDGGKIVKTVQQHNDKRGAEVTTTTRQYDADGNLVGRGESTTRTWSRMFPEDSAASGVESVTSSSVSEDADGGSTARMHKKLGGWFWTK
ncbi:hypothetical protein GGS23DRAFT_599344 [Durotheca rogersii]|uniref:uncharacterized protein n=1 Tax=Durotheca rogersii TaxID=419775 RepID=UPI00221EAD16|nr:uncharacterized protein GGS23DRAFT_599344 [Durotheca rogersii]KAI5860532.1 hypothetical protein GGS23DRAFT_599344 [Durotheca rogersii]